MQVQFKWSEEQSVCAYKEEMTRLRLVYGFTYSEQVEPIQRMFWLFLFVSIKILEGDWIEKRKNQSEQMN